MLTSLFLLVAAQTGFSSKVTLAWDEPWTGWGCSLAWWAKALGNSPNAKLYADLVFGDGGTVTYRLGPQKLLGLKLNVVRYNVGGGGPGNRLYNGTSRQKDIQGFWPKPWSEWNARTWDWNADAAQRNMLRLAIERGADTVQLFSDSPMWWMTKSQSTNGALKREDNLDPKNISWFTHYLAEVANHMKGLRVHSVEAFNEPSAYWWNIADHTSQEGCCIRSETQALTIPQLRADLDNLGLQKIAIAASDENDYTTAARTWKSFLPEIQAKVGLVTAHSYFGLKPNRDDESRRQLRAAVGNRPLWMTEFGDTDGDGKVLAETITHDLYHLRPEAWCYWQPIEESSGWGLLNVDYKTFETKWVYTKFAIYGNFTRFIRPGMFILRSDRPEAIYAYDRAKSKLVIVVVNDGPSRETNFDLSAFKSIGPRSQTTWTAFDNSVLLQTKEAEVNPVAKARKLELTLPANCVAAIEVPDVVAVGK